MEGKGEQAEWLRRFEEQLPEGLVSLLDWFRGRNWPLYLVGGCLRDAYLGRPIHDYDLACGIPAETLKQACAQSGLSMNLSGFSHGTIGLIWEGKEYEITAFRKEGEYTDSRHPDRVVFTPSIEEDLARRDFTCNAMAWTPKSALLDPFGGISDLQAGVLRCVGNPSVRFAEDKLRILRALRLVLELGLVMEPDTASAFEDGVESVRAVSGPRQAPEWKRLLVASYLGESPDSKWVAPLWKACFPFSGTGIVDPGKLRALPGDWRIRLAGACYQALAQKPAVVQRTTWAREHETFDPPRLDEYEKKGPGRDLAFQMARHLGLRKKERNWLVACLTQRNLFLSNRMISKRVGWVARGFPTQYGTQRLWLSGSTRCKLLREMQVRVGQWDLLYALQDFGAWKQPAMASVWKWRKHAFACLEAMDPLMHHEQLAITAAELAEEVGVAVGPWVSNALQNLMQGVWRQARINEREDLLSMAYPVYFSAVIQ